MAGVVAMAAVIEDFEATQPCKKLRKDDELPPPKTITNYFMPLPKSVEKPFSPPRSSNIMDYFRKTSPAQEKIGPSQKCSPLQSAEPVSGEEVSAKLGRAPRQKRTRKSKEQSKPRQEEQEVLSDGCVVLGSYSESLVKEDGNLCMLGSDTAALLSQISSDICIDEKSPKRKNTTETCANDGKVKDVLCNRKSKNQSRDEDGSANDGASPGEENCRNMKSVVRKSRKARVSQSDSCTELEQSLADASLEVNLDETSVLNRSTVTVSFEDFLQSQSQDEEGPEPDTCGAEAFSDAKSCNDVSEAVVAAPQVSPRTLTVRAEVHPISPNHDSAKSPEVRVASIFSRNKKERQVKDGKTSSATLQVTADILPDLKRKSNVVLHEEDLELAVVESSSTPKCTQEERKQFMNAFKQPSLDGSKGKPTKCPGKPKQVQEKAPELAEKEPDEKAAESKPDEAAAEQKQSIEQKTSSSVGKKRSKKSGKKKQNCASEEAQKHENLPTSMDVDMESGSVDDHETQPPKEVRRSARECTRRQTASVPEKILPTRRKRSQEKVEKSTVSQDDPALASTPKSHRPKKSVYRAEMLCPPDRKESPIRMKFTRVFPSSATKVGEFDISSPVSMQESNSLKKRKQAKKLVQKAKALQQSKQTAAEEQPPVRRSARRKETVNTNYCEDEDSVVFVEDNLSNPVPTSQESGRNQKSLRSLNDVLGKHIPQKTSKNAPASKLAPMFLDKKAQKPTAVISIFDDNSRDGSENSQDDEQFRAKREFLKSGLPESFKKQIAKTAANREAYTQACASFQPVVHVQQRVMDCSMWTLQWPKGSFLSGLKEFPQLPLMPRLSSTGLAGHTTAALRTCREKVSGCQEDFTESVKQRLLEEISSSNPSFPVQRYFTRFLKRYTDYLLQSAATTEPDCGSKTPCVAGLTKPIGGKRKRVDEGEKLGKLAKKQKSNPTEEEIMLISEISGTESGATPETTDSLDSSRGRRRRSLRQKQTEEETKHSAPENKQCDTVIILDSPSSETASTEDGVREDMLWTEKYQPQHSNDIIGNTASVRKLHSWLKEWKLRADREERKKQQEAKQGDDSNDSWTGDSSEWLEDAEDLLCNTLLITGPTGVGKTAAVYACAQELGFKVFEVNCSSQRSGRQILSQLKEATQSHQVDIQGVNAHKPTYFNSYSSSSSSAKTGSSPRKLNSPRRVMSSPRKPPQSPRGAVRKGGLAPTSLANFFKMGGRPTGKDAGNKDKKSQTACSKKSAKMTQSEGKNQEPANPTTEEQGKRTATSLILFEEVDVIFDDDSGFLAAIKTFMATTKRPVILTTSDPTFSAMFDGYFDEIHFKAPSVVNVASYLQLMCLVENVRTDTQDLASLLRWNRCDVRQSLLHLQFWVRSGGGRQMLLPVSSGTHECEVKKETVKVENASSAGPLHSVPPCHTGCTESFLGLLNLQQDKKVEDLLKCDLSAVQSTSCLDLLSETKRRGLNLLYSNMEVLLPLPISALAEPSLPPLPISNPEPQTGHIARLGNVAQQEEHTDDTSPLKVSSRMRRKKQLCLDDKNVFQSDSESEDGFLSLPNPNCNPAGNPDTKQGQDQASQEAPASEAASVRTRRVPLSEAERKRSKPVSQCLRSIAEYLDHMSFLDSSLHYQHPHTEGACRPQAFDWTGAEVKSGMTDEVRLECGGHTSGFESDEINAVIAGLSFWKCRAGVSDAWEKAQALEEEEVRREAVEELTLPVPSHRRSFSLAHSTPCEPRVMEMRREVMSTVLNSRSLNTLGNRVAAAVDFLPSLRTICRSERLKEQGKVKRRFMHYFNGIHLDLPKSTVQHLASDFP
ncbi:ATPase family AAA domain-containing protein 5 [Salminus brasiliensis]|uniref:ATPase family AAA domain-containing protein 5 n=1 Tax=Salminus brasiliensis TaxID=930266 RepID=UPI003B836DB1